MQRKLRFQVAALFIVGGWISSSNAGGDAWPVMIEHMKLISHDGGQLIIKPIQTNFDTTPPWSDDCKTVSVAFKFDPYHPWPRRWIDRYRGVDDAEEKLNHRRAIRYLQAMFKEHAVIKFGEMGTGLSKDTAQPCMLKSGRLEFYENSGFTGVFSFR